MATYKIIFESGESEIIEVGSLEFNRHLGRIEIKNSDGSDSEDFYLNFEHISAIIPQ